MEIPKKVWILSVICLILPLFLDTFSTYLANGSWFFHLIPIFFFTYYFGIRGGVITCIFSIFIHFGWNASLDSETIKHQPEIWSVFVSYIFLKITVLGGVRYITRILNKNQEELKLANKTLMKQAEDLELMAYHDPLTGLPNRYMLNEYIQYSLIRSKLENQQMAVLFMDLDRFKMVNDTMGHNMGDLLLKQVTERLKRSVRTIDIVSRQGGDEFILLLENMDEAGVVKIAERIISEFAEPFNLNDTEFFTSTSIGISMFPRDGEDVDTLIKRADQAMYETKASGGNGYQIHAMEMSGIVSRRIKLEQGLRKALSNDEFMLHYQPQINLSTNNIVGVEALIRWNHPELGLISPMEFIPIAEETGIIIQIGKFVLNEACKQLKLWHDAGHNQIHVAVNVSPRQFRHKPFVSCVKEVIEEVGIDPKYLELEITESIMHNMSESKIIMNQLKKLGINLSLDDFGTGYSSLNVLSQLPIDVVKIDKSFVDKIGKDFTSSTIIKTIIELGSTLNFGLVAEGVETDMQAAFLLQHRCDVGQGYLYSKPITAKQMDILLGSPLGSLEYA
jgi:diguanylate cyclase (GGDEF)-like protein